MHWIRTLLGIGPGRSGSHLRFVQGYSKTQYLCETCQGFDFNQIFQVESQYQAYLSLSGHRHNKLVSDGGLSYGDAASSCVSGPLTKPRAFASCSRREL